MSDSSSGVDGLVPVYIGSVDDPATLWITPIRSTEDENVMKVIEMEQQLSEYCHYKKQEKQPVRAGSKVAVRKGNRSWVRGLVESVVTTLDGYRASVFLIDWGQRLPNVNVEEEIRKLPEEKNINLQQLAFKFVVSKVLGPWGDYVLEAVKKLVKTHDGAFSGQIRNAGGHLEGDLYLKLPFDGDWQRSIPPILLNLIEEYDTELVHLNRVLNDIAKRSKLEATKDRSEKFPPYNKNVGDFPDFPDSNSKTSILPKNIKARHPQNRSSDPPPTMRNYLADMEPNKNDNSSYKMNGVGARRNGNLNSSIPHNSSVERDSVKLKPGLGRADRLKHAFGESSVGRNRENSSEAALEQSGSGSSVGEGRRSSVINSVKQVSRGEMLQSQQSNTFGTGRGGVQLTPYTPGGGENMKKKKKFDEDMTEDDIADMLDITRESGRGDLSEGIYRPAKRSETRKLNENFIDDGSMPTSLKILREEGGIGKKRNQPPQRMYQRGKGRGGLDSSGEMHSTQHKPTVAPSVSYDCRDGRQDRMDNNVTQGMGNSDGAETRYEMIIPAQMIAPLIGKEGNVIKRIREESGARLRIKQEIEGLTEYPLSITGSKEAIEHAKTRVKEILEKNLKNFAYPSHVGRGEGFEMSQRSNFGHQNEGFDMSREQGTQGREQRFLSSQRNNLIGPDKRSGSASVVCEECEKIDASFLCKSCPSNLCSNCFDSVHKASKTLSKHQKSPLQIEEVQKNQQTNLIHPNDRSVGGGEHFKTNQQTHFVRPDERSGSRGERFERNQRNNFGHRDVIESVEREKFKTTQLNNIVHPDERSKGRGERFKTNQQTNSMRPGEHSVGREPFEKSQRREQNNFMHPDERPAGRGECHPDEPPAGRGEHLRNQQPFLDPDGRPAGRGEHLRNQQPFLDPDERSAGRGERLRSRQTPFVHPYERSVEREQFKMNQKTNSDRLEERSVGRGDRLEESQGKKFVHPDERTKGSITSSVADSRIKRDAIIARMASKGGKSASATSDHLGSTRGEKQIIEKPRFVRKPGATFKSYTGPIGPYESDSESDEDASKPKGDIDISRKSLVSIKSKLAKSQHSSPQHGNTSVSSVSGSSSAQIVKSSPEIDHVSEKDSQQFPSIDSMLPSCSTTNPINLEESSSESDSTRGQSSLQNKPKLINFRKKANEATLTNTVEDNESQIKPLKNEMKEKLKEKIKKHKENKELMSENDEANKPTNAGNETDNIQEREKSEDREVGPESEESDGEQNHDEGEDPLENLIRNLNKTTINQGLKDEHEQSSLTMTGRKFQERFNSREAWTRLLIHRPPKSWGVQRPCRLADHVTQPAWHGELIRYLRQQGVTYSSIIQAALWPAVSRLTSVVGIAGKGQGKTVGWILPLLSQLSDHDNYSALPPGKGPTAVVLAPGWNAVRDIAETLADVSSKANLQVTVAAGYAGNEMDIMPTLINGVDILVATPACLLRLINQHRFTDLERCCHFIVEEGDRILEWFPKEVDSLMVSWREVVQTKLKYKGLPYQTIIVAESWTEPVKQFTAKNIKNVGLIVLGSLLEGVVYGQLPIKPHFFMDSDQKIRKLLEVVAGRGENRVCICCRDAAVGQELVNHLLQIGVESLFIREDDEPGDRQDKIDDWRIETRMPLILTDLALMFVIDPIPTDILLHWDLPRGSKKEFGIRFTMLKPAMKSFFGEAFPMKGEFVYEEHDREPENACVHLMLGKEDCDMLKTIKILLKRTGTDIPPELDSFYFGIQTSQAKERCRSGEPLCSQLASRGVCRDRKLERCKQRHFLDNELDQPIEDAKGILSFLILFVESPVRYWVRIQDPDLDRKYQRLVFKMGRYFTKESNIIVLMEEEIITGKTVVARSGDGVYRRARVLSKRYDKTRTKHRLHKIEIFLLDDGHTEFVYPGDLVQLPLELGTEAFPPSAAAVVVAGLIPQDRDEHWSVTAELFVNNKLNLHNDDHDIVCRGRILLAIGNTYWINKCQLMVRQANIGKYICAFETRDRLLESNHAVENPGHMEPLYQLAARAGIARPEYEPELDSTVAASEAPVMEKNRVAFLPLNSVCDVYVSEVYSPGEFYVTKVDHIKSLNALERDMGVWAEEKGPAKAGWHPRPGECVMARIGKEDPWLRGRVTDKLATQTEGGDCRVFFVDAGYLEDISLTNLRPIDQKFILRLPFQAVKCILAYVKPNQGKAEDFSCVQEIVTDIIQSALNQVDGDVTDVVKSDDDMDQIEVINNPEEMKENLDWPKVAGDTFFDLTRNPSTDEPESLVCEVTSVEGEGPDRQYLVLLYKDSTDIGMQLVNAGLARDTYDSEKLPVNDIHPDEDWEQDGLDIQNNLAQPENGTNAQEIIQKIISNPEDWDMSQGKLETVSPEQWEIARRKMAAILARETDKLDPNYQSDDDETSLMLVNNGIKTEQLKEVVKVKDSVQLPTFTDAAPLPTFTPLQVSVRPPDMPAPAPAVGLSPVEIKTPALFWSQDHNYLRITVTVSTVEDPKLEHVYLRVDSQGINVQVSEIQPHISGDEFIIHTTGFLKLYSKVCTHGATLRVTGRSLVITIKKRTTCHWRQLTKQKLGWIKLDHDRQYSTDSECEESLPVNRPEPGFLGKYVKPELPEDTGKVHEPRYNKVTGEQVLPEHMFESSDDELGSENQDLDFLHDTAVDNNNDVPY